MTFGKGTSIMQVLGESAGPIVVGVKVGKSNLEFIKRVCSAWKQTDVHLHLVSVVQERLKFPPFYAEILGNFDFSEFGRMLFESEKQTTLDELLHLQRDLRLQDHLSIKVVCAQDPAAALISEAQRTRASLIAIEADQHLHQTAPQGLAVAFGTLQHSGVPVLILRKSSTHDFEAKNHCMVIADDLSGSSIGALREGIQWAARWRDTRIIHLHVIDQKLHTTMRALADSSHRSNLLSLDPSAFMEMLEKTMAVALKRRAAGYLEMLERAGCSYETRIEVGNPGSRISSILQDVQPDLAVLGRRQSTLPSLFGIGHVAFAALLADCDALLVVP